MKPHQLIEDIIIFSIVVPIILGLIRYKRLEKGFLVFFWLLIYQLIYTCFSFIRLSPQLTHLFNHITELPDALLIISVFFLFAHFSNVKKWLYYLGIVYCFLVVLEIFFFGVDSYRQSPTIILFDIVKIIAGVFVANKILEEDKRSSLKTAKLLIVIPMIFYFTVYSYFTILMAVLYKPETALFFINLSNITNRFELLVYFAYSIAFLCLPKKKIFL